MPCIDEKMYGRQGLCPIACVDLSDKGGCMLAQIVETVQQRIRTDVKVSKVPGPRKR